MSNLEEVAKKFLNSLNWFIYSYNVQHSGLMYLEEAIV